MAEWKKVIVSGSNANLLTVTASAVTIGNPEDSTYTDGLYTDFTTMTPVGVAVDRFNEILKGLSPSPAPDLSNVEGVTATGAANLRLAFGTSNPVGTYVDVTGTGSLPAVNFTQAFAKITGAGGGLTRLGIFADTVDITARLNENVAADGSPFVNYTSNSFDVPTAGGESYTLEINGVTWEEGTTGTNPLNGTYFTLSAASNGAFPATGLPFNIFANRQGTVTIPIALQQEGWNYCMVYNSLGKVTNFIDWVVDPEAASSGTAYNFANFTTASVSATGTKWLSGIPYLTGFGYAVTGAIENYYLNTYSTASIPFSSVSTGVTATAATITTPLSNTDALNISASHTLAATGRRLLGTTLESTLQYGNIFGKNGTTGTIVTPTILLDNTNTANTTLQENFCLENYRVASSSYDTQNSLSTAVNAFTSGSSLSSADLLVYNGAVRYNTQALNSGNIAGAGIVYTTGDTLPNYSGATGDRYFMRGLVNGSNADATFNVSVTGTNTSFVPFGTALTGNNVRVKLKIPGKTGWRDLSTDAPASTSGIALNDNVGCRTGAQPSNLTSLATATFAIDLKTEGLLPGEYFVISVQAGSSWAGSISQINITGL